MRHELPHNRGRHRVGGSRDGAAHVRRRHERFDTPQTTTARTVCFGLFVCMTLVIFWAPLTRLVRFSLENEHYSHIILIPLISGWLLATKRTTIFARVQTRLAAGIALVLGGGLLYGLGHRYLTSASENDRLSSDMVSIVVV